MRCLMLSLLFCAIVAAQTNLVPNGDFELDENGDGIPDFWTFAGASHVKQQLVRDVGRDGKGFSGKLICTEFGNGTPASHAMICQVGTISVQRGRWYRLSLWAKAEGIRAGLVRVALVNTRVWSDVGLHDVFAPTGNWQRYEFFFQATNDLPAKESRLQIWFNSTGTLWLDDVELVEIPALSPKRLPQIPTEGVVNFLPNSSFECGTAGWGSYAPDLRWWMGNVFRLIGELDNKTAVHGKHSLRIVLDERNLPTFYFDWFDPIRQPIRSLVVANHGWISVNRGQPYTLSAFMKADRKGVVGILFVRQSDGRNLRKDFPLTTEWQRYTFTFTPQADFVWVGAGLDLTASKEVRSEARSEAECRQERNGGRFAVRHETKWSAVIPSERHSANASWLTTNGKATVWLDAVQLERGNQPSEYRPRRPVELTASTDILGNIFVTESSKPMIQLKLRAFADEGVRSEARSEAECRQERNGGRFVVRHETKWSAVIPSERHSADASWLTTSNERHSANALWLTTNGGRFVVRHETKWSAVIPSERHSADASWLTTSNERHSANASWLTTSVKTTATIVVRDFFDAEVLRQTVKLDIPVGSSVTKTVNLPVGKFGFYRIQVLTPDRANFCLPLRCAVIKPYRGKDSRWGMNHAYPWQFLLRLAHQAGILWWRDWSVQWRTVQPKPEATFDFSETDIQIDRVLKEGGKALVLFPFPSAEWSTSGDPAQIEKVQPLAYRRQVMLLACRPKDEQAFARYIAESVRHYRNRVTAYHIFNEPLYTFYSLPASLGHTLDDYIRLLKIAYNAIKAEQPDAIVVGGIGIWADNRWTREFVENGGLKYADVLDLHLYSGGNPEGLCEPLRKLWERMKQRGEAKPIWLTELGCYADDDPPIEPLRIFFGDAAMRSAFHSSERAAAEWLVKFATLFFANGGAKIFLHAGTCGEINGTDTGSVFFEYGGTPRKIYPAIAAMANLLPPEAKFERAESLSEGVKVYWFKDKQRRIGIAWAIDDRSHQVALPPNTIALDIMGNPIAGKKITVGETPTYLAQ